MITGILNKSQLKKCLLYEKTFKAVDCSLFALGAGKHKFSNSHGRNQHLFLAIKALIMSAFLSILSSRHPFKEISPKSR